MNQNIFCIKIKADKDNYTDLIWDTSVRKYKSKDGEGENIEKSVRSYRLEYSTNLITQIQNQNNVFVIQGKPAQGATK